MCASSYVRVTFTLTVFFFSSRRRHTRWPRDWSSDVCSSDLCSWPPPTRFARPPLSSSRRGGRGSEERRVGKECRWLGVRGDVKEEMEVQMKRAGDMIVMAGTIERNGVTSGDRSTYCTTTAHM